MSVTNRRLQMAVNVMRTPTVYLIFAIQQQIYVTIQDMVEVVTKTLIASQAVVPMSYAMHLINGILADQRKIAC